MDKNILVINLSKTRKPDLWMLSAESFTDEEIAPYRGVMRRRKIRVLPPSVECRWGKLYDKATLLEELAKAKANK